nr:hypothetical protein [Tanacetum cinerariifolium]
MIQGRLTSIQQKSSVFNNKKANTVRDKAVVSRNMGREVNVVKASACWVWKAKHITVAAQNTNNTAIRSILLAEKLTGLNFKNWYRNLRIVLRYGQKMKFVEQPIGPAPNTETADPDSIDKYYESINLKRLHDGQSVSSYLMKIKSYMDTLECLGYAMPNKLDVSLILNSRNKDYVQFVQNYNMHGMGKTLAKLHDMLKLHEKCIPNKAETSTLLAIWEGRIQKDKKKPHGAKGKDKGKNKLAYAPKAKISPPPKRDNLANDSICHQCKEVGHWKRSCLSYHAELKKRNNASVASTSGIFTIKLYALPNKTWVYDTGYGTHICNTSQGLRESRKLKHGALSLYMGNGMHAAVEAIRSFDLVLSRDMHNLYLNVSSMYNVSNKRVKHALNSYYLWHCYLGHINKKCMDMLQHDGLLQPTHDESHEKCKSCISGKMAPSLFHIKWKELRIYYGLYTLMYVALLEGWVCGVSERRNQTLLDMVRSMMNLTTLPKSFWGYALETTAHILNLVPTKKVYRTPYEIWHRKAPKLSYLKVRGCEALVK